MFLFEIIVFSSISIVTTLSVGPEFVNPPKIVNLFDYVENAMAL